MAFDTCDFYTTPDHFYVVPSLDERGGSTVGNSRILVIDRITNDVKSAASSSAVPLQAEKTTIYGIIGVIHLVSGPHLLVISARELVGELAGHKIWRMTQARPIAYARTTMHLTEKEVWYNRHFLDMINLVLGVDSFYFSNTFDLTHSLQRLENTTADFKQLPMHERADERFLWNKYVLQDFAAQPELHAFLTPLMHGFVGIRKCRLSNAHGTTFKLALISRRSTHRVGPRFCVRGLNVNGHPANFVETEQILEYDQANTVHLCSHVQIRGSIPLLWKQTPNLRWQPQPELTADDQTQIMAFRRHFDQQMLHYQSKAMVIVDLVNQKGREKNVGAKLKLVAEQSKLLNVSYYAFDFHKHCKGLNWDKLCILQTDLAPSVKKFGYFYSTVVAGAETTVQQSQTGYFRTNCMDCLDRTNVVQSLLAKTSLINQLQSLGVLANNESLVDGHPAFDTVFKNLWADNGDACSVQYSGTGALKADFTRFGVRTVMGSLADGQNAITRYFKNNFSDGYKQDALDVFLGYYVVDRANLPVELATGPLDARDWRAVVCLAAVFSVAATLLCLFALADGWLQWTLFWLLVLVACVLVMFINGPDFVNAPKLHQD